MTLCTYFSQLVIMVGDPKQLAATVLSRDAVKYNYGQSLFEVRGITYIDGFVGAANIYTRSDYAPGDATS